MKLTGLLACGVGLAAWLIFAIGGPANPANPCGMLPVTFAWLGGIVYAWGLERIFRSCREEEG